MNYQTSWNILPVMNGGAWGLIAVLVIVDLILKGMALWRAGRNGHQIWFVLLLILNTVGILPLIYLVFFDKPSKENKRKK